MTKKTKHLGHDGGAHSSAQWLAPSQPYTGDGRTKRSIFDKVVSVMRKPNGKKIK